jgi:hypothetical protein
MPINNNLKFLHIHCGDASAKPLKESSVPGDVMVWREIYIEGPVPGNLSESELMKKRAEFISSEIPGLTLSYDFVLAGTKRRYQEITEAGKYEEVILWFDSCMFDQTIMIHLIELCAKQNWSDTKLSLICVDRGLGEMPKDELVALIDVRREISLEQKELASKAWRAFISDTPEGIESIITEDCLALPFLKDAFIRHLEQFPSVHNGLSRTQEQIMQVVSSGVSDLIKVFIGVSEMEERPFMGDTSMWQRIDELAECRVPLLKLDGPGSLKSAMNSPDKIDVPALENIDRWKVSITESGKEVLAGKQDHLKLNGVDSWLGGVHLTDERQWRWDRNKRKISESASA